jgi:hypothetical protein
VHYREHRPPPELAPYVRSFWTLRDVGPEVQRILPDGSFDIVFHLGEAFARDGERQPAAMLIGEVRRPVIVRPTGRADVLGIRFRPGGAAPFLRAPAAAFSDAILPLREVFASSIEEQVFESRSTRERLALLSRMLIGRYAEPRGSRLARAAAALIASRQGAIRIRDAAALLGSTERTLERAFAVSIGVTAKTFARLARFQSALNGGPDAYFDDSHRIRDFHEFGGATPGELQRELNLLNEAFVGNVQDNVDARP